MKSCCINQVLIVRYNAHKALVESISNHKPPIRISHVSHSSEFNVSSIETKLNYVAVPDTEYCYFSCISVSQYNSNVRRRQSKNHNIVPCCELSSFMNHK